MLQNATCLRTSAPWPLSMFDEDVFVPATQNSSLEILFTCPCLPSSLKLLQNLCVFLIFGKMALHPPLYYFSTIWSHETSEKLCFHDFYEITQLSEVWLQNFLPLWYACVCKCKYIYIFLRYRHDGHRTHLKGETYGLRFFFPQRWTNCLLATRVAPAALQRLGRAPN